MTGKINNPCKKLDTLDAAYIAGFIDADGWIGTRVEQGTIHRRYKNGVNRTPAVQITQKFLGILEWIQETTGVGNISLRKDGYHSYTVNGTSAVTLLQELEPYIRFKQNELGLVLEEFE